MAAESQTMPPVHRLDVETYNRIVATGALEGRRVELLDGLVVDMSPRTPSHDLVIERLTRHFASAPVRLRVQMAIEIPPDCEPEPDLALVAEPADPDRHPRTALLAIEVAVTSQMIDRNVKAAKYARAGIPSYWLIDVPGRTAEVRTDPGPSGYARCQVYAAPASVPSPLEGVTDLDLGALLARIDTGT
jgi:Uma2 family endonuclease